MEAVDYRGFVAIEYEEENPEAGVPAFAADLRVILNE
jgi:hypothetical protein